MPPTLPWSDALALGLDAMDTTHREFVELIARCETSADAALPALWDELIEHTAEHFGREDAWMERTGFAAGNCHATQHRVVLQVLREGARLAHGGHLAPVRQMVAELAAWFVQHAQTMDAALALHLRSVGFDFEAAMPAGPLPAQAITGCGAAACS